MDSIHIPAASAAVPPPVTGPASDGSPARSRRLLLQGAAITAGAFSLDSVLGLPGAKASTSDPYYPSYGDSRYSVSRYEIGDTVITSGINTRISGATRMVARAVVALTSLEIDFALRPSSILVNGVSVPWQVLSWRKIRVTGLRLAAGASFTILVRYDDFPGLRRRAALGQPGGPAEDGMSIFGSLVSFYGEPNGSAFWYPSNDRITNKATYSISVSTQRGNTIVSSGILASRKQFTLRGSAMTNAVFALNEPVHSYAPALHVGRLVQKTATWIGPGGQQVHTTFSGQATPPAAVVQHTLQSMTYFAKLYGPYPFSRSGAVTPSGDFPILGLENVGGPIYAPGILGGNTPNIVAHEQAHMYFGNSVTCASWKDVALIHEGLATILASDYCAVYAPWLTFTHRPSSLASNPGTVHMFDNATYISARSLMLELRYAMDGSYLQARAPRFTAMLRGIVRDFRYGSITRAQFKARAQAAAGKDLSPFWRKYGI